MTAVNQLWVADITYIRLRIEFVFLAVVIDRYSRKAPEQAALQQVPVPGQRGA